MIDLLKKMFGDPANDQKITDATDMQGLLKYLKQPTADDKLSALFQGMTAFGNARSQGANVGDAIGAGALGSVGGINQGRANRLTELENQAMLKKLFKKPIPTRRESFGKDAQGNPIKFYENVDEEGNVTRVEGSEMPYWQKKEADPMLDLKMAEMQSRIDNRGQNDSTNQLLNDLRATKLQADIDKMKDAAANPVAKPPTEGQAKANAFTGEMEAALADIDAGLLERPKGEGKYDTTSYLAGSLPFIGNTAQNAVMSPSEQKVMNGYKRLITAKLRADSGATITDDEIATQVDQAMPKYWDSKEVVAQKKNNLQTMIDSVRSRGNLPAKPPTDDGMPKVGDVVDGHTFMGGDPASPASWRAQ
jgi:hypothetical protein